MFWDQEWEWIKSPWLPVSRTHYNRFDMSIQDGDGWKVHNRRNILRSCREKREETTPNLARLVLTISRFS